MLAAAALLAACAQTGGHAGGGDDPCNPVVGAMIGGALGVLTGGGDRRAGRALIGAGIGAMACMALNYSARQTRTAEQVGGDYRARNGELPPAPLVTAYRTQAARATAKGGEDVTVTSSIEIVPGRSEPLKELREEFAVVDPRGVERSKLSKTPAATGGGGAYVSTLQFTFPQGVPPGAYQVQSRLFVNGKPAQQASVAIQVARAADGSLTVALDGR